MGKQDGSRWNYDTGEHARAPQVDRFTKIERLVQAATLDIDSRRMSAALVPKTRTARRTKSTFKRVTGRRIAQPIVRLALEQPEITSCDRKGNPKRGRRLLPTLRAMADIKYQRLSRHGVSNATALATAHLLVRIQNHDTNRSCSRKSSISGCIRRPTAELPRTA